MSTRSKREDKDREPQGAGTLYLVATPIGNLGDITLRALDILRSVDLIAAEDTRHSRKLLSHFDIHKPLVSYHSHNAETSGPELIRRIEAGASIALITDAGAPGISDPGMLLAHQAIEADIQVTVIPGAAALIVALTASGLSTQPFAFLGFPPPKGSGRRRFFSTYASLPMTVVVYESPQRLLRTLSDIREHWGDRRIAVARELTKQYEEFFRGTVEEAQAHFSEEARGEFTLVVEGAELSQGVTEDRGKDSDWREELRELIIDSNLSVKEATEGIVGKYGLSKRLVYQEALMIRKSL